MKQNTRTHRLVSLLGWAALATVISGENYCQRSYSIGSQSNITATPTDTVSPTPTPSESPTPEETPTPTATTTTPTPSISPTPTPAAAEMDGLFRSLEKLSTTTPTTAKETASLVTAIGGASQRSKASDWLGKIYNNDDVPGSALDSDNDGYSDALEQDSGTDPLNAKSTPPPPVTRLIDRLQLNHDDDGDGVTNEEEQRIGTDPEKADTDGDGCSDGAEVLSKSSPLDAKSRPSPDYDGDCITDSVEISMGLDFKSRDSDGDGVRDDVEIALGMNPLGNDTDSDGILDAKELELGSDPTVPEAQK